MNTAVVLRYCCIPLFCLYSVVYAHAQPGAEDLRKATPTLDTTGWTIKGNFGINFTSIGLLNWAGGGDNATSILGLLNAVVNYHTLSFAWDNAAEFGYGLTWLGPNPSARKSDDRIIIISKVGIAAAEHLRWTGFLDFRTQFTVGEDYTKPSNSELRKLSNFFAPAFLTIALGAEWKPENFLSILVAPITGRFVFVNDSALAQRGSFGVPAGQTSLANIGTLVNFQFKRDIWENVNVATRLNIFSAYTDFSAPIINWENLMILKINRFLNVSLTGDLIYGVPVPNSSSLLQLRGIIAIGFALPFSAS
ncbi:MAG: DUF3078 domain-containing protein [Bacteroidota bacterium]|nr:DUF3078 domain-containing protein [Candidatus Kapabacteria bacterium]MDW8220253.1 DUF3078 domain-containing protein [Bacteroidota bacterium]